MSLVSRLSTATAVVHPNKTSPFLQPHSKDGRLTGHVQRPTYVVEAWAPQGLEASPRTSTSYLRRVSHFLFLWDSPRISEMLRRIRVSHLPFLWDSQRNSEKGHSMSTQQMLPTQNFRFYWQFAQMFFIPFYEKMQNLASIFLKFTELRSFIVDWGWARHRNLLILSNFRSRYLRNQTR